MDSSKSLVRAFYHRTAREDDDDNDNEGEKVHSPVYLFDDDHDGRMSDNEKRDIQDEHWDGAHSSPSKLNEQGAHDVKPLSRHPLFERPDIRSLILYTLCCALIYPFLFAITLVSRGRSLFEVRLIVGLGCTIVSFVMGIFLLKFAKRFMEASTWATLLQQNGTNVRDFMTLDELSELASEPTSVLAASRLLQVRRRLRRSYQGNSALDQRHMWHAYILFFAFLVAIASVLSFALGRIVNIVAQSSFDYRSFAEVSLFGDLTQDDTDRFPDIRWNDTTGFAMESPSGPVRSMGSSSILPTWRYTFPSYASITVGSETIYFGEPYSVQLRSDGFALAGLRGSMNTELLVSSKSITSSKEAIVESETSVLQYSRWGVRVACGILPGLDSIAVTGNDTLIRVPRDFVSRLYSSLNLSFPEETLRAFQPIYRYPFGIVPYLLPFDDTVIHAEIGNDSSADVLTTIRFPWPYELTSGAQAAGYLTNDGSGGDGWTIFDIMVIRVKILDATRTSIFNATYSPNGSIHFRSGYEAIGCVHRTEAWVSEVYNSTRLISTVRVLGKGANIDDFRATGHKDQSKLRRDEISGEDAVRTLSSEKKLAAFVGAYSSSTNAWLGQANDVYMGGPSALAVSWTDGIGYANYTNINATLFQEFRAATSATTFLPLLSGSQRVVARRYEGRQVAFAHILPIPMAIAIAALFLAGVVGCVCVPALPNGYPQRRFDLYSWVAAMEGDGLRMEGVERRDDSEMPLTNCRSEDDDDAAGWRPGMPMESVEKEFGSKRIRYPMTS